MEDARERELRQGLRHFERVWSRVQGAHGPKAAAERCGTSDEIADAGAFLLGEHAGFITGTDLLIDGGVIAAIRTGAYKLHG